MDLIRKAFEDFFMPIQIIDDLPKDEKQVLFKEIEEFCAKQVPEILYRFRDCSKWSIQAFENNQLYMSNANAFNDPYDSLPYFEEEKLPKPFKDDDANKIEQEFELIRTNKEYRKICAREHNINEQNLLLEVSNPVKNKFEAMKISALFTSINYKRNLIISSIKGLHRKIAQIACFSETENSIVMWSHYSNFHTGFVLEYNTSVFNTIHENSSPFDKALTYPLPIIYSDKRYNITNELITLIRNDFLKRYKIDNLASDTLDYIKPLLLKQKEWIYEKEWRLIRFNDTISKNYKLSDIKPSAVILGAKISKFNKYKLVQIAREKGITVYQMEINYNTSEYILEKNIVSENFTIAMYYKEEIIKILKRIHWILIGKYTFKLTESFLSIFGINYK